MEDKKVIIILIAVILIAAIFLCAGAYFIGVRQGQAQCAECEKCKTHNVATCMQDFSLEAKKVDAGIVTNPMENMPEANPFNKVKTNPFE